MWCKDDINDSLYLECDIVLKIIERYVKSGAKIDNMDSLPLKNYGDKYHVILHQNTEQNIFYK